METLVFLTKKGNKATNSQLIAQGFDKQHKHVLELIDKLIIDLKDGSNFRHVREPDSYAPEKLFFEQRWLDSCNRWQRNYLVSEQGFRLVAMRMSGPRALGFQVAFIEQFDQLTQEVQQLRQQVSVTQATEEIARLARYTEVPVQIEAVKNVAGALIGKSAEGFGIINHHRAVMKALTGERPSVYVQHAVEEGLRVRGKSGRAVLRLREPAKAATAAVLDDTVRQGKTLDEAKQAGLIDALPKAFEAILSLGLKSADLEADKLAA